MAGGINVRAVVTETSQLAGEQVGTKTDLRCPLEAHLQAMVGPAIRTKAVRSGANLLTELENRPKNRMKSRRKANTSQLRMNNHHPDGTENTCSGRVIGSLNIMVALLIST